MIQNTLPKELKDKISYDSELCKISYHEGLTGVNIQNLEKLNNYLFNNFSSNSNNKSPNISMNLSQSSSSVDTKEQIKENENKEKSRTIYSIFDRNNQFNDNFEVDEKNKDFYEEFYN